MTDLSRTIAVKPVIKYPREAQVGKTYLMTIDLQPDENFEWHYGEEEYPIYCSVDSNLFNSKPVGEPVVVLHRFGGSYGEAKFLLSVSQERQEGYISIVLINQWGFPVKALKIEDIQLMPVLSERQELDLEFLIEKLQQIQVQEALKEYGSYTDLYSSVLIDSKSSQDRDLVNTGELKKQSFDNQTNLLDKQRFNQEFVELQNPQTTNGRSIHLFIQHRLRQFGLNGVYDTTHVLNEAYVRGIELINNGRKITSPSAWVRGTTLYIIQEFSRESQKYSSFDLEALDALNQSGALRYTDPFEEPGDELTILQSAFQRLSLEDQAILNLSIVQSLSWKQVREILQAQGYEDCSEIVLRQRSIRALKRLRYDDALKRLRNDDW